MPSFFAFSGFPRCSPDPPEKGEKSRNEKADFQAAGHPSRPHVLHPQLRQPNVFERTYRSIQIDYRQSSSKGLTVVSKLITERVLFWEELISDYRYRIALPEELISITETDLWEFQQKISHYRYRFSLEF